MSQYDNTNSGVLFKNDRKESEKHPDYTGKINVNGEEFWLSAWIKSGQRGRFMSLSVRTKDPEAAKPAKVAAGIPDAPIHDDDIPF